MPGTPWESWAIVRSSHWAQTLPRKVAPHPARAHSTQRLQRTEGWEQKSLIGSLPLVALCLQPSLCERLLLPGPRPTNVFPLVTPPLFLAQNCSYPLTHFPPARLKPLLSCPPIDLILHCRFYLWNVSSLNPFLLLSGQVLSPLKCWLSHLCTV